MHNFYQQLFLLHMQIIMQDQYNKKSLQSNHNCITYRNAIYQGDIDSNNQKRNNFGIIYIAQSHQFVCCNNWHNDFLQGQTIFFNQDRKLVYGTWINNLPQGFNTFRIQQTLFMTQFNRGKINKNTKILLLFEKYNLGVILVVTKDSQDLKELQFDVYTKKQVFTSQDVRSLFNMCQWPQKYFMQNQTLIKYITNVLITYQDQSKKTASNSAKLRLIENRNYRFGFDKGLAIIFDQFFDRISVGYHNKGTLQHYGIKFQKPQISRQKNSMINSHKDLLRNKSTNFEKYQAGKIYQSNLLMGVNFCNKFYKNPSNSFIFIVSSIINANSLRELISGSLTTRKLLDQESLNFSEIQLNQQTNDYYESLIKNDQLFNIQPIVNQKNKNTSNQIILSKQKIINDRLRLQAIKKQVYDSLERRVHKTSNKQSQKFSINRKKDNDKKNAQNLYVQQQNQKYYTPQKQISKSRSRKRIFEESQKNLKLLKDFTPSRSAKQLTPFKTKMRNRIFTGESQSNHQIREYLQARNSEAQNRKYSKQKKVDNDEANLQRIKDLSKYSEQNKFKEINQNIQRQPYNYKKNQLLIKERQSKEQNQGKNPYRNISQSRNSEFENSYKNSVKKLNNSAKQHLYVPINTEQQINKIKQNKIYRVENQKQAGFITPKQTYKQIHSHQKDNLQHKREFINNQKKAINSKNKQTYFNFQNQAQTKFKSFNQQNLSNVQSQQNQQSIQLLQKRKSKQTKIVVNQQTYNDNTFNPKQNNNYYKKLQPQIQQKSERVVFKHSNKIYLDQNKQRANLQQNEQNNRNFKENSNKRSVYQMQNKRSLKSLNQTNEKNMNYINKVNIYANPMMNLNQKSYNKTHSQLNSSYMKKYKLKKSIDKQIQKSPDRFRCYGKNSNSPYVESSPNRYTREYSFQNNNSYNKSTFQYESPQKLSQTYNFNRSLNKKFF